MAELIIAPSARRDLQEITLYIRSHAGGNVAHRYVERLIEACETLSFVPLAAGVSAEDLGSGLRRHTFGNYLIVMRASKEKLEIVRVLHSKRDVSVETI